MIYCASMVQLLEYTCPAWHSSLTAAQSKTIEVIQRRAMQIIFADNDYTMSLIRARMDTLESWRAVLTEWFFRQSVLHEASCLHYLLPNKRDSSETDRLRHTKTFRSIKARAHKFRNYFCHSVYNILISIEPAFGLLVYKLSGYSLFVF